MQKPVRVEDFVQAGGRRLKLQVVAGRLGLKRRIGEAALNRPQLALAGFFEYFAPRRIQLIGLAEYAYLSHLAAADRTERLRALFAAGIPCVVFARHKRLFPEVDALSDAHQVPVIRSRMVTRNFMTAASRILESLMAPREHVPGTMIEVAGQGLLLRGPAGIGKSETALGLIRRGCALVADDVTDLRRDGAGRLIAAPIGLVRHHMEIRGIGIIYIPSVFGIASVRGEKQLDLVVTLLPAAEFENGPRGEQDTQYCELLGVRVPEIQIPVAPGRDLVNLIEAAALEHKLRQTGVVAERELDARLRKILTPHEDQG